MTDLDTLVVPDAESQIDLPTFDSSMLARRHGLERLAGAYRVFGRAGFGQGVAGHITFRDPVQAGTMWLNPFGRSFRRLRVSDLLLVDFDGRLVHGDPDARINRAAVAIHAQLYRARPDVQAAAHAHSPHGEAWTAFGRGIEPISQDACAFFERHRVLEDFTGAVEDVGYGQRLAASLGDGVAVLHQNHGVITVGSTVDEAAWWFILMDRCCKVQLLAEAAGTPRRIDDESARNARSQVGNSKAGWLQFQPFWEEILHEEPDLLG